MIALVLAALAVPVALVILGVRQVSFKSSRETAAAEAPGLRTSLELAADKNFAPPEALMEERAVFVFMQTASGGNAKAVRQKIEQEIVTAGGVVVPSDSGKSDRESLLVKIPVDKTAFLKIRLQENFTPLTTANLSPAGEDCLVEIQFPNP